MKKFLSLLVLFLGLGWGIVSAQTPTEMQYQLLVLNPETGQVRTSEDVAVRLELRQGSATGQAVWSQDFSVRTDARGLCQLTLDFGSNIDWQSGNFYLASVIDGKECGAPKLTSVPYAMQAARLDGVPKASELVGSWYTQEADSRRGIRYWTIKADGTGSYRDDEEQATFTWRLFPNGSFLYEGTSKDNYDSETYTFCNVNTILRLNDAELLIVKEGEDGVRMIKQSN